MSSSASSGTVSTKSLISIITALALVAAVVVLFASGSLSASSPEIPKATVWLIGPDDGLEQVDLQVNDVLDITPFIYPVGTPHGNISLKVSVKNTEGDPMRSWLDYVGEIAGPDSGREGAATKSVLLKVRDSGKAIVTLELKEGDRVIPGQKRVLKVNAVYRDGQRALRQSQ